MDTGLISCWSEYYQLKHTAFVAPSPRWQAARCQYCSVKLTTQATRCLCSVNSSFCIRFGVCTPNWNMNIYPSNTGWHQQMTQIIMACHFLHWSQIQMKAWKEYSLPWLHESGHSSRMYAEEKSGVTPRKKTQKQNPRGSTFCKISVSVGQLDAWKSTKRGKWEIHYWQRHCCTSVRSSASPLQHGQPLSLILPGSINYSSTLGQG